MKPKKIMLASTVYGFEHTLTQMCALIESQGHKVLNSHYGTIAGANENSNLENCLNAVRSCDIFIGIIRPFYGTGVIDGVSITHSEFREAIKLKKKCFFAGHTHVDFSRQLLRQFMYDDNKKRTSFSIKKTSVMDSLHTIDLYDEVIQNDIPVEQRIGTWVQPFTTPEELKRYLDTILENVK